MTQTSSDKDIARGFDKDTVVQIVNSVVSKIHESDTEVKTALRQELVSLHQIIQELRGEISSIRAKSIKHDEIPTATDELDAVVEATEEATGSIMDSVEEIEKVAENLDEENAKKIGDQVVNIYEACSFQDITGQRITKVINALQSIEAKVDKLLKVVNSSFPGALEEAGLAAEDIDNEETEEGKRLINGPALPDQKVSQDDIDAILAEFDD